MIKTIRRTLPHPWLLWTLGFVYVVLMLFDHWHDQMQHVIELGDPLGPGLFRAYFAVICCGAYGFHRAWRTFPLNNASYFHWLSTTPWHVGRERPIGPLFQRLYWADAIVPCVFLLGEWFNPVSSPAWIVSSLLIGYLLACVRIFCSCQKHLVTSAGIWYAYGLVFGFGMVFLCRSYEAVVVIVLVASYWLGQRGLRSVLSEFPWTALVTQVSRQVKLHYSWGLRRLGWGPEWVQLSRAKTAFQELGPCEIVGDTSRESFATSGMIGWWAFVLTYGTSKHLATAFIVLTALFLLGMALLRYVAFCRTYRPPIDSWGRIRTFRLIIPGYDVINIAPVIAVSCACLAMWCGWWLNVSPPLVVSLASIAGSYMILEGKPSFLKWRLTGHHRVQLQKEHASI